MLTGRYPFHANSLQELRHKVITQPVPNVKEFAQDVDLAMREVLSQLMEKSPENRPANAMEAYQLFQAVLGQTRDVESMLVEAFEHDPNVKWKRVEDHFEVQLTLPDGRGQKVYVQTTGENALERLLMIFSPCAQDDPGYYHQALRLNSEIPHGGLAIREIHEKMYFVMVDTYPRGTVDADSLRRSVYEVGSRADYIENLLTGEDIH